MPPGRGAARRALGASGRRHADPPRLLVIFTGATLLVVAAVVALSTGWWWLLPVVLVIHLAVTALVMGPIMKALSQGDKPDPVTEARIEEQKGAGAGLGVPGPEDRGGDRGGTAA